MQTLGFLPLPCPPSLGHQPSQAPLKQVGRVEAGRVDSVKWHHCCHHHPLSLIKDCPTPAPSMATSLPPVLPPPVPAATTAAYCHRQHGPN